MRAIELTAQNFSAFHSLTSLAITCVLCSAPPHFFKTKGNILALCQLDAAKMQNLGAPKNTFRITMQNLADARVLNSGTMRGSAERDSVDLFDNLTALGF